MDKATRQETTDLAEPKVLYVRLPANLHHRLKVAAVHADQPMSQLAREAVVQFLDRTEQSNG